MNENLDDYIEAYTEEFKYSLDNKLILKWYPRRINSKMNAGNLLELGLGHGYTIQQFLNSGKINNYRILEGSKEIIEKFKKENPKINLDIKHIYFEDYKSEDKFDNIIMGFILEHVHDPELIISKFKKHLNPNGKMFIAVPNSEALNRRFGYESGLLKELDFLSEEDKKLGHKRYFNKEKLLKMIKSNGLKAKSIEGLFLKPITTDQIIKLKLSDEILLAMLKVGVNYPELCTGILIEAVIE